MTAGAAPAPARRFRRARARHLELGRRGEAVAARLLRTLGLDILARNYHARSTEIDLVARDLDVLCFVEVKTRHRAGRFRPAAAVDAEKQRHLIRAAAQYLREIGRPPVVRRFDIVEVILAGRRLREVRYWPAAFSGEDGGR